MQTDERERLLDHILAIDRRFYRYLQAGGDVWANVDLTMPQLKVLFLVAGGREVTMTQLARSLGMTLSTATGVVDRLVAQGLVRREDHPEDRRLVLVRLTEPGSALVDRLLRSSRARFRLILERLSLDDLRIVARALDALYEAALGVSEAELASGAAPGSPGRAHQA